MAEVSEPLWIMGRAKGLRGRQDCWRQPRCEGHRKLARENLSIAVQGAETTLHVALCLSTYKCFLSLTPPVSFCFKLWNTFLDQHQHDTVETYSCPLKMSLACTVPPEGHVALGRFWFAKSRKWLRNLRCSQGQGDSEAGSLHATLWETAA